MKWKIELFVGAEGTRAHETGLMVLKLNGTCSSTYWEVRLQGREEGTPDPDIREMATWFALQTIEKQRMTREALL